MQRNQDAVRNFGSKIGGDSSYLNGGDIDVNGILIRPLPWSYNELPVDVLMHLEGWTEKVGADKKKHPTPVRFEPDAQIDPGIEWQRGTYMNKPTVAYPKAAIAFLCWIPKLGKIKLASFTQATIVKPIHNMMLEANDEGVKNPNFVDDLTKVELFIKKNQKDGKFEVSTPKCKDEIPDEAVAALQAIPSFSFEAYMNGEDPFAEENNFTYEDAMAFWPVEPDNKTTKQTKATKEVKKDKEEAPLEKDEELLNWRDAKSPRGTRLGDMGEEKLKDYKGIMEKKKMQKEPMYRIVCYALEHVNDAITETLEEDDIPF